MADSEISRTGARSGCRECHQDFYRRWTASAHGRAMRPYGDDFSRQNLKAQKNPLVIQGKTYRAQIGPGQGWLVEEGGAEPGILQIRQVLGGKYLYFFLIAGERGGLHVAPLAYDPKDKAWLPTGGAGIGHGFNGRESWSDPRHSFNTACRSCHVGPAPARL